MIELLVKYITDKGYDVRVEPRYLVISRTIEDQIVQSNWYILPCDLRPEFDQYLQMVADQKCWQIDKAIAERYGDMLANIAGEQV